VSQIVVTDAPSSINIRASTCPEPGPHFDEPPTHARKRNGGRDGAGDVGCAVGATRYRECGSGERGGSLNERRSWVMGKLADADDAGVSD
jgi:hypothetical protein